MDLVIQYMISDEPWELQVQDHNGNDWDFKEVLRYHVTPRIPCHPPWRTLQFPSRTLQHARETAARARETAALAHAAAREGVRARGESTWNSGLHPES